MVPLVENTVKVKENLCNNATPIDEAKVIILNIVRNQFRCLKKKVNRRYKMKKSHKKYIV